jgi:hypothetical protein
MRDADMTTFHSVSKLPQAARYRVLVNGFADGRLFPTLDQAVDSVPTDGVKSLSFEIYDTIERQFVWSRPKQRDSRSPRGPFSIRANGHPLGLSFVSLDEAGDFISARPPGSQFAVFQHETCVFMAHFSRRLNLVEAL